MNKDIYSKKGELFLKDVIFEIIAVEDSIEHDRLELTEKLQQMKETNQTKYEEREHQLQQDLSDKLKNFEAEQNKALSERAALSEKRLEEVSAHLLERFETNKQPVVSTLLKEVESIYGHF